MDKEAIGRDAQSSRLRQISCRRYKRSGATSRLKHAERIAVLQGLKAVGERSAHTRAVDLNSILNGMILPQRFLSSEADRLGALGFPVVETYLRSAGLSVGHAETYLRLGLEAEGRGEPPPDAPDGLLNWL